MNEESMTAIAEILGEAVEYGLTAEVVMSGLSIMKDDPTLSEVQALRLGLKEWIK